VSYLLDTDICIYWLKGNEWVREAVLKIGWGKLAISIVTKAELYYGAFNSVKVSENLARAEAFTQQFNILPLNDRVLRHYGDHKAQLRQAGNLLPDFDLLIACTALAEERILVTNNTKHFTRIPGLKIENWLSR